MTIDHSVKYIAKNEQTRDSDSKTNTMKSNSLPRKQNKKLSQNFLKIVTKVTREAFSFLNVEQRIVFFI